MKKMAGPICLASFCAGTIGGEYEAISRLGGAFVLIAAASALAVLLGALFRAPEGYGGPNGLHVRPCNRRSTPLVPSDFLSAGCGENRRDISDRARNEHPLPLQIASGYTLAVAVTKPLLQQ